MKFSFFENIPSKIKDELFETIIENKNIKIEKIISKGNSYPKEFWYDQKLNEFVVVLKGAALIQFKKNFKTIYLKKGEAINIKANEKHRVLATSQEKETVWLAVHYA
ncbi:MAG: phosphoribosylaminoimidazole carboxylase [Desulforegulaceae bacterium]|nr:phosphoribosylaminoimidazole carboxylase [Desulforegulaceae bacterium]